ncbi:MAG: response regulator [Gammaproteobacteria bacterium]|nr:response regulator [Gammaproteobacteria bacterium]
MQINHINFFCDKRSKNIVNKKSNNKNHLKKKTFIRPPKILVIEDSLMIQKLNMMSLESIGCNSKLAPNATMALEMFIDDYDLILSDIGLPDKNGKEIAKAIRQYEKEAGCKRNILIALTSDSSELQDCLTSGFDDFYVKPLLMESMQEMLMRWLPHLVSSQQKPMT